MKKREKPRDSKAVSYTHLDVYKRQIPFRLVCDRCYQRIMSKGYDGEYYTEADEQIEDDY